MRPHVELLLGQPWSAASVLPEVVRRLRDRGVRVAVRRRPEPRALRTADLVVLPALAPAQLEAVRWLDGAGWRCCNTWAATWRARHKGECERALAAAAVPRPATRELARWPEVLAAARDRRVVVKPLAGRNGRGVLDGDELPARAPFLGPYLVQERVEHDGTDRKLFVVGDEVRGVLRPWPCETPAAKRGRPFSPEPELCELARRAGAALALELFGVDVLVGPDGPVVVDVNAFPGYKGVADAPLLLAVHLARRAREGAPCGR